MCARLRDKRGNGASSHGFMLWAYDGNCSAEPGPDKFRVKIWKGANEDGVVYDHGGSHPNGQSLGGGSVVVHGEEVARAGGQGERGVAGDSPSPVRVETLRIR